MMLIVKPDADLEAGIVALMQDAGFDLNQPVDEYQRSDRSVCYVQGDAPESMKRHWKWKGRRQFCFMNGAACEQTSSQRPNGDG